MDRWRGLAEDKRSACLSFIRSVACLNQGLFALNETYLMNEKGASAIVDSFAIAPSHYSERVNEIFSLSSEDADKMQNAFHLLRELIQETEKLKGESGHAAWALSCLGLIV